MNLNRLCTCVALLGAVACAVPAITAAAEHPQAKGAPLLTFTKWEVVQSQPEGPTSGTAHIQYLPAGVGASASVCGRWSTDPVEVYWKTAGAAGKLPYTVTAVTPGIGTHHEKDDALETGDFENFAAHTDNNGIPNYPPGTYRVAIGVKGQTYSTSLKLVNRASACSA